MEPTGANGCLARLILYDKFVQMFNYAVSTAFAMYDWNSSALVLQA